MKKFLSVLVARNKEYYRDKGVLAWSFLFPFIVVIGFAFAFSGKDQDIYKIGIYTEAGSKPSVAETQFLMTRFIQFVPITDLQSAIQKVERHKLDLLLSVGSPGKYWINSTSPKGYFLEKALLSSTLGSPTLASPEGQKEFVRQEVEGKEIRYVDWLIPGILAMNMMFSALFGVGYTIVRYRKNGVLKRLKATPLGAFQFLLAQVVSRLIVILIVSSLVYTGCNSFVHFRMIGSYPLLFMLLALGAICMISLSLIVAARIKNDEVANGLLNALTLPMIFLSGVWFSLEGANPWVLKLSQFFPLTHIIEGARAVMIDGAGLTQVMPHIIVLAAMTVLFMFIGSVTFRWN